MMYRTELVEEITVENVTEKNQCQNRRNGKGRLSSCHDVFFRNGKSSIGLQKRAKG